MNISQYLHRTLYLEEEHRKQLLGEANRKPWTKENCHKRLQEAWDKCVVVDTDFPMVEFWRTLNKWFYSQVRDNQTNQEQIAFAETCHETMIDVWNEHFDKKYNARYNSTNKSPGETVEPDNPFA